MLEVYFDSSKYVIKRDGAHIVAGECAPTHTYSEVEKLYIVLLRALSNVDPEDTSIQTIKIYSDSRIIDDMTGTSEPLTDFCRQAITTIRARRIPAKMRFTKISGARVAEEVGEGTRLLLDKVDDHKRSKALQAFKQELEDSYTSHISRGTRKFKEECNDRRRNDS